ncbi:MAG: PIN domain-containing protein [Noviherbaspirillum sp.]
MIFVWSAGPGSNAAQVRRHDRWSPARREARLLKLCEAGEIEIMTPPALLAELGDVLKRVHLASRIQARDVTPIALIAQFQAFTHSVSPKSVPAVIADDPDDDHVLACAVDACANLIGSGDKHLLRLGGHYNGIPIVKAGEAITVIEAG